MVYDAARKPPVVAISASPVRPIPAPVPMQASSDWPLFQAFWNTRQCFVCECWGECDHREVEVARAYLRLKRASAGG